MKILQIIGMADPASGGPIEAVRNLAQVLTSRGHLVEIVSLDPPASPWLARLPVKAYGLGPGWHKKYRFTAKLDRWLEEHVHRFDCAIIHGIWQYSSFGAAKILRRYDIPYFVFTHGMLDPWFKYHYPLKHLKKWLYWPWAEYRVLRHACAVFFTSEEERVKARKSFWLFKCNERVVNSGTAAPTADRHEVAALFLERYPEVEGKRVILFLGRLHPKKGCDVLIQAFSEIANLDSALHLVMAGPDQIGWQPTLETLASRKGISHRITWTGMLGDELKWGALYSAEVFVLPSHSENFGIAVVEAISCGVPVLISDKVNIWREISTRGAGLVAEDTVRGTVANFGKWLQLPPEDKNQMKLNAQKCFYECFEIQKATQSLLFGIEASITGYDLGAPMRSGLKKPIQPSTRS